MLFFQVNIFFIRNDMIVKRRRSATMMYVFSLNERLKKPLKINSFLNIIKTFSREFSLKGSQLNIAKGRVIDHPKSNFKFPVILFVKGAILRSINISIA